MDTASKIALITGLFSLTFMLNLSFGFFRAKTKKFSFKWFLYIHLPIPIVILGRLFSHLDFKYIPIFISAAVLGQIWGGRLEL